MSALDLDRYLARVDFRATPRSDAATLRALHAAHLAAIPFENIDVRLGRVPRLDLIGLQEKLVQRRRGGYCFEHNTLFAAVLRAVGLEVQTLEARVRPPGAKVPLPRTHMVLRVEADGGWWLADVGFGGDGARYPVPFEGALREPEGTSHAIASEPEGVHVLRRGEAGEWSDVYAFTLAPALEADFEVANHFTATHPRSPFVNALTVQRATAETRTILRGRTLRKHGAGQQILRELSDQEVVDLVVDELGLEATPQEVRRALG
jgi:N-hydroxyarylamine O-acetyltransferase